MKNLLIGALFSILLCACIGAVVARQDNPGHNAYTHRQADSQERIADALELIALNGHMLAIRETGRAGTTREQQLRALGFARKERIRLVARMLARIHDEEAGEGK